MPERYCECAGYDLPHPIGLKRCQGGPVCEECHQPCLVREGKEVLSVTQAYGHRLAHTIEYAESDCCGAGLIY